MTDVGGYDPGAGGLQVDIPGQKPEFTEETPDLGFPLGPDSAAGRAFIMRKRAETLDREDRTSFGDRVTDLARRIGLDVADAFRSGEAGQAAVSGTFKATHDLYQAVGLIPPTQTAHETAALAIAGFAESQVAMSGGFGSRSHRLMQGPARVGLMTEGEPQTGTGAMVEETFRFFTKAAPVVAGTTAAAPAAIPAGLSQLVAWALGGGAAGFTRDPSEPSFADFLEQQRYETETIETLRAAFGEALARRESDGEFTRRVKRSLEEMALSVGGDLAVMGGVAGVKAGAKAARGKRARSSGGESAPAEGEVPAATEGAPAASEGASGPEYLKSVKEAERIAMGLPAPVEQVLPDLVTLYRAARKTMTPEGVQAIDQVLAAADDLNARTAIGEATEAEMRDLAEAQGYQAALEDMAAAVEAWHGSPHSFEAFDVSKIGTGEGAQAFGYGLYFASRREVAEHYRRNLRDAVMQTDAGPRSYADIRMEIEAAAEGVEGIHPDQAGSIATNIMRTVEDTGSFEKAQKEYDFRAYRGYGDPKQLDAIDRGYQAAVAKAKEINPRRSKGRLYKVELTPKENEYLLWDKPLSEQPEKVREALKGLGIPEKAPVLNTVEALTGKNAYERLAYELTPEDLSTTDAALAGGMRGYGERRASEALHAAGIRGIKYLEGASRGKGEGNYNYVVFSDQDVRIVAAEAVAAAPLAALAGEDDKPASPEIVQASLVGEMIERVLKRSARPSKRQLDKVGEAVKNRVAETEATNAALMREKYGIDPAIETKAEGLDFNFDRIKAPDDVKGLIDTVSEALAPEIDAYKRGKRTLAQIEYDAALLDMSPADVMGLQATSAEEFTKARHVMLAYATRLKQMAEHVATPDATDRDLLRYERMIQEYGVLQMHVKGLQTEIARSLSAMRIMADAENSVDLRAIDAVLGEAGGRRDLKRMAQRMAAIGDPKRFAGVAAKAHKVRRWDMFLEVWYGALLSNINTHVVNFSTSFGATMYGLPEMYAAALVGSGRRLMGGDAGVTFRAANQYMLGLLTGTRVAARNSAEALWTGLPSDMMQKLEGRVSRQRALTAQNLAQLPEFRALGRVMPDAFDKPVEMIGKAFDVLTEVYPRGVTRLMITADEFNKGLAYTAMLRARAVDQAQKDLLAGTITPREVPARINELLRTPPEDIHFGAVDFARQMTFQSPAGRIARPVQQAIDAIPGGRLVMPFVRVAGNLTKYTASRTPAAPLLKEVREGLLSEDRFARDLAAGRIALGSAIGYGLYSAAGAGYITGGGPTDYRLKRNLEETGWQEYSLRIPKDSAIGREMGLEKDRYVSFKRFDPFSQALGLAADLHEVGAYMTDEEREEFATVYSAVIYRNVMSRTWMTGLSDFFEALPSETGDVGAMERYIARLAGSLAVPAGAAWIGRTEELGGSSTRRDTRPRVTDDLGRDIAPAMQFLERIVNQVRARMPGENGLPRARNFWGEEVDLPPGLAINMVPIYSKESRINTAALKAAGLPTEPFRWAQLRHPYDMTDAQHLAFVRAAGIDGEAVRLGNALSYHPRRIEGVALNPDEHETYVIAVNRLRPEFGWLQIDGRPVLDYSGMTLKQSLTELIATDEYRRASDYEEVDNSKIRLIRKVVNDYRHNVDKDPMTDLGGADAMLMRVMPQVFRRIERHRIRTQSPQE